MEGRRRVHLCRFTTACGIKSHFKLQLGAYQSSLDNLIFGVNVLIAQGPGVTFGWVLKIM